MRFTLTPSATHTNTMRFTFLWSGKRQKEMKTESRVFDVCRPLNACNTSVDILLETDSTCIMWIRSSRKWQKQKRGRTKVFYTHTHTNWHMNRSISKLALICICCSICCVHLTKFKTLFAVSQCDVHCISGQYYCLPFLRYSFSMQNATLFMSFSQFTDL